MATISTSQNITAVSYASGETLTITSGATLTIDATPATQPGIIQCITSGKLSITNSSTTTPIVVTLSSNSMDFQFEKNGILEITGQMIELGTATGSSGETFSLNVSPYTTIPYPSYVEVETASGSGEYTPYFVVSTAGKTTVFATTEFSGNNNPSGNVLFWNATTRVLTAGTGTNGNLLPTGAKVRIPNIYIHSGSNNATPANRTLIDIAATGTLTASCCAFSDAIYFSNSGPGAISLTRVGFVSNFTVQNSNFSCALNHVAVQPDTQQNTVATTTTLSIIVGAVTINKLVSLSAGLPSGAGKNVVTQCLAMTQFDNCVFARRVGRTAITDEALALSSISQNLVVNNLTVIGGRSEFTNLANNIFVNYKHADDLGTTQLSSANQNAILGNNINNIDFIGFGNAGTCVPFSALFNLDSASGNVRVYNMNFDGKSQVTGLATGTATTVEFYNCALSNVRTGPFMDATATFLSSGYNAYNCRSNSGSNSTNEAIPNSVFDYMFGNDPSTSFTGGSEFCFSNLIDFGSTPTTGRISMGPFGPSATNITLSGTASYSQTGLLELPTSGDSAVITSAFTMHGIDSFQNTSPIWTYVQGGITSTATTTAPSNVTATFEVKTPTGTYSTPATLNGANLSTALSGLSGYASTEGFVMRVTFTATSTDSTRTINKVYFPTNLSTTYSANDSTITLSGPSSTDTVYMYQLSDDTLIHTFTGGGTFSLSLAAYYAVQVYFVRESSSAIALVNTALTPITLSLGDNGTVQLFYGDEVQAVSAGDFSSILADTTQIKTDTSELLLDTAAIQAAQTAAQTDIDNLQLDTANILADTTAIEAKTNLIPALL